MTSLVFPQALTRSSSFLVWSTCASLSSSTGRRLSIFCTNSPKRGHVNVFQVRLPDLRPVQAQLQQMPHHPGQLLRHAGLLYADLQQHSGARVGRVDSFCTNSTRNIAIDLVELVQKLVTLPRVGLPADLLGGALPEKDLGDDIPSVDGARRL